MGEIFLIRHGQTKLNSEKRIIGLTDIPLNENGIEDIKKLKSKIKDLNFDKIYSSDLKRCVESAEILFNQEIILNKSFREIDFGKLEGMTIDEIKKKYQNNFTKKYYNMEHFLKSSGENFNSFYKRVINGIKEITKTDQKIAIVTHGGCIKVILSNFIAKNKKAFANFNINNASLTHIFYEKNNFALISMG